MCGWFWRASASCAEPRSFGKPGKDVGMFVHEVDCYVDGVRGRWRCGRFMTTQGLLFLRTVMGLPVLLTSAVTREKLFLASARSMVGAGMVSPVFRLLRLLLIWAKLGLYNRPLSNSWRQVRMANPCGKIKR